MRAIYQKLQVHSKPEAVGKALRDRPWLTRSKDATCHSPIRRMDARNSPTAWGHRRAAYCTVTVPAACQSVLLAPAASRPATYTIRFPANALVNVTFT